MTRRTEAWLSDYLARSKASAYADQKVEQAIPVLTEAVPLTWAQQMVVADIKREKEFAHQCAEARKPTKYRNQQTGAYASKREARRAEVLKAQERVGMIRNLREQVPYLLVPAQYDGKKCVERSVKYIADFVYERHEQATEGPVGTIVEDAKGMKTRDYVIKRKLMLFVHKVAIKEV